VIQAQGVHIWGRKYWQQLTLKALFDVNMFLFLIFSHDTSKHLQDITQKISTFQKMAQTCPFL
jgi:hypothetical protein